MVAIYKGGNATCCDHTRSFLSCNRVSLSERGLLCCMEQPVACRLTQFFVMQCELSRQLVWAYASAQQSFDANEVSVIQQPGSRPLLWNSFTFIFSSAGAGTYHMVYYSHRMGRIVLQIDHNPRRDYAPPGTVFAHVSSIPADTGHRILGGGLELCPPGTGQLTWSRALSEKQVARANKFEIIGWQDTSGMPLWQPDASLASRDSSRRATTSRSALPALSEHSAEGSVRAVSRKLAEIVPR